ncbi:AbrB family transcriptional regulator [Larsenimonas suaedae]|uniref:AbrB family transcriptional regulator n=1 Tax=Larsenimonas suaedae TaxID=1851019 RepID=A0ABU1GW82_9GAMM|nr:AbrB family transcriptional regulator [Larsenimonas suaedae]MCM2973418.1 AbrB family transcriptional regulator [Larsenimonas suaedae]MDR5896311.1 AbrB family transcriptional regulator [Larsenimonas suaedae]
MKHLLHLRLSRLPATLQWPLLLAVSAAFAAALELVRLPAALLLGPMIAGILFSLRGSPLRIARPLFFMAQTLIGCMIASSMDVSIIGNLANSWWLFLAVTLLVIFASSVLGWLMAKWQVLPGTTAIWGSSPGGASVMMLLAESQGADMRLVAFMQYLRVLFVAVLASVIARLFLPEDAVGAQAIDWFPTLDAVDFTQTLLIAAIGGYAGLKLKLPAGQLLVPMIAGSLLSMSGAVTLQLPEWLLAISYAVLGWRIGLGFTPAIMRHATRALPKIILSIVSLITLCGLIATVLVYAFDVDPLTAYMATSPGGLDSIAIISASSNVDIGFIMTFQTVRFLMVLAIGPPLAKYLAGRLPSH